MLLWVHRWGVTIPLFAFCLASTALAQRPRLFDYKKSLAPYVTSPQTAVDKMLQMANLKSGETLYDLGCGDGRIVITAAKKYEIHAIGVEISEHLVKSATQAVKQAKLEDRVKIIHGDILQTDLHDANVVTIYLMTAANENVRPNLERYLRNNARVVSYDYPIPGWREVEKADTEGRNGAVHEIYLYQVPTSFKK